MSNFDIANKMVNQFIEELEYYYQNDDLNELEPVLLNAGDYMTRNMSHAPVTVELEALSNRAIVSCEYNGEIARDYLNDDVTAWLIGYELIK